MLSVLGCCDASLVLLEGSYPSLKALLEDNLQVSAPVAQIAKPSSGELTPRLRPEVDKFLQLTKIIITLCANQSLRRKLDDTFKDLVEILQDVDPMERFLQLIANHNLYWILEKILDLHTVAVDVFAGIALTYAVELVDYKLVTILLQRNCPLDAKRYISHFYSYFTALKIAVFVVRDLKLVDLLLEWGRDLGSVWEDLLSVKPHDNLAPWWKDEMSADDSTMLQNLLGKLVSNYHITHNQYWERFLKRTLYSGAIETCTLVLSTLISLAPLECRKDYQAAVTAVLERSANALQHILEKITSMRKFQQNFFCQCLTLGLLGMTVILGERDLLATILKYGARSSEIFNESVDFMIHKINCDESTSIVLLRSVAMVTADENTRQLLIAERALERFVERTFFEQWSDMTRILMDNVTSLHKSFTEHCSTSLLRHTECLQNPQMFKVLLGSAFGNQGASALIFIKSAIWTGDISLLQRMIRHYESLPSGTNEGFLDDVLESPELLLSGLFQPHEQIMLWFFSLKMSLHALNDALHECYFGLRDDVLDNTPKGPASYTHSPSALKSLFNFGLHPSRGILAVCAVEFEKHSMENMRLVVQERNARDTLFSIDDMTLVFRTWRDLCKKAWRSLRRPLYQVHDTEYYLQVLLFFIEHGVKMPNLNFDTLIKSGCGRYFENHVREFLTWGRDPLF